MRKLLLAVACCATIGLASARADVTYRYVTDKAAYTGAVGSLVPVQIFLQETVTAPSTSLRAVRIVTVCGATHDRFGGGAPGRQRGMHSADRMR